MASSRIDLDGNAQAALAERVAELEVEIEHLRLALSSRIVIEQAKGAISVRCNVTPEEAFEMLRALARSQRRNMHEYAAAIMAHGGSLDC